MILFIQLLLQVVSPPLLLFLSVSFTEQDSRSYFVQLMRPDHIIFCSGTESALDKLWTSTGTSTGALYKHYKLYKHNKQNKQNKTRVSKCAPARSSLENELVRKWTGEKEKEVGDFTFLFRMMLWPGVLAIFIKTFVITSPVLMVHVTCAIIIDGSKVLVTQRSEAMKLPLKWEFPGGKINLHESAETCIKRELIEELNIEVELLERLNDSPFEYPTFMINLIPFVARIKAGQLTLREHKALEWLHPNELKALDWAPADIPVLEQFMKSKYAVGRTL